MEKSNQNEENQNNLLNQILLDNKYTKIIEILSENHDLCIINILGETKLKEEETLNKFILKIKKKEFNFWQNQTELNTCTNTNSKLTQLEIVSKICSQPSKYFDNDIYTKYSTKDFIQNNINVELIYPAPQKQIEKYRHSNFELFSETYDIYLKRALPFINSIPKKDIQWIYNTFERKTEVPLGEAPSKKFLIFKDYKNINNEKCIESLGLPIPEYSYLRSIRDLSQKELGLLEEFYTEGRKIIAKHFGCKENEIKAFLHYPPSFYYLHVHYVGVNDSIVDGSSNINRAIDLGQIIQNIKMKSDYYQTVTIDYTVQVGSKLYAALNSNEKSEEKDKLLK